MLSGQPNSGAFKKCYLCLGTCVTHVLGPKSEEGWLRHQENFGEALLRRRRGGRSQVTWCERRLFLDGCALSGLRGLRPPAAIAATPPHEEENL